MFNLNEGLMQYLFEGKVADWKFYLAYALGILAIIVIPYLLGSINSAIIISKVGYNDDIRKHGSGNAGLTNMLRTYGLGAAGLTLLGDILKTVLAIFIAGVIWGFGYVAAVSTEQFLYVAGLFAVLGHIFPIYYKFKGGKGVLATATMALMLSPIPFAILLAVFAGLVVWTRYVSLGSVVGVALYPVIITGYFMVAFGVSAPGLTTLCTVLLAILIVWCHRGNLQRISDRTERKISFKKKEKDGEEE